MLKTKIHECDILSRCSFPLSLFALTFHFFPRTPNLEGIRILPHPIATMIRKKTLKRTPRSNSNGIQRRSNRLSARSHPPTSTMSSQARKHLGKSSDSTELTDPIHTVQSRVCSSCRRPGATTSRNDSNRSTPNRQSRREDQPNQKGSRWGRSTKDLRSVKDGNRLTEKRVRSNRYAVGCDGKLDSLHQLIA